MSGVRAILYLTLCIAVSIADAVAASPPETHASIDETEFARRLTELERAAAAVDPSDVRDIVRRFALDMVHSEVRVRSARVIATYKRVAWKTRPYYAVNYVRDDYFYLDEMDPDFQDELAHNLHWVSVVKTLPDRQLMFELAIDQETSDELAPDEVISFSCEIAGVIRGGKSVYSRLLALEGESPRSK